MGMAPGLNTRRSGKGVASIVQQHISCTPLGRAGQPGGMVDAAIFLASDESVWMTGSIIAVDGRIGRAAGASS